MAYTIIGRQVKNKRTVVFTTLRFVVAVAFMHMILFAPITVFAAETVGQLGQNSQDELAHATAINMYDPYSFHDFTNPILAVAMNKYKEKKTFKVEQFTTNRWSGLDTENFVERIVSNITAGKSASAIRYPSGYSNAGGTAIDYNKTYGLDVRKCQNSYEVLLGTLASNGMPTNFDDATLYIWNNPYNTLDVYVYTLRGDFPVFHNLLANVNDCGQIADRRVDLRVEVDRVTHEINFKSVMAEVVYCTPSFDLERSGGYCKLENPYGNAIGDATVYTILSFSAK